MNKNIEEQTTTLGYDKDMFCERVSEAMHLKKYDFDKLAEKFCKAGYEINSYSLKTYIKQRNPSLKLLLHLSKALNVSIDWLIGNEVRNTITLKPGFDYDYDSSRYAQYDGEFFVYFYPTRTNEPEEIIKATLTIEKEKGFHAKLKIPIADGEDKLFTGHLILSQKTNTAFLSMSGSNGEQILFTFNDPNTNQNKLRFSIAALNSVSSGDAKRMPTLSRAIISEKRLTKSGEKFLNANLRLNSKYIDIHEEKLLNILKTFLSEEKIENSDDICNRVKNAFKTKTYLSIEEQYFLNTFRAENNLSNLQIESLIATLRNHSMSDINCKTPRSLDARLYLLLRDEGMFETTDSNE